jgi:hypothetical protein
MSAPTGPHGSLLVAVQVSRWHRNSLEHSALTIPDLDLRRGVALGYILDAPHDFGHGKGWRARWGSKWRRLGRGHKWAARGMRIWSAAVDTESGIEGETLWSRSWLKEGGRGANRHVADCDGDDGGANKLRCPAQS